MSDQPRGGRPSRPGDDRRRPSRDHRDAQGRQRGAARAEGRTARSAAAPSQRARRGDAPRTAALETLRAVAGSDAYANLVLPPLLRQRRLHGRDAAFATELTYGTLRLRGRYDAVLAQVVDRDLDRLDPVVLDLLRLGAHQLLGMRVPVHAAVSETVALAREQAGAGAAQLVNAVLRRVSEHPLDDWLHRIGEAADPGGTDTSARLAVVESHPAWVVRAFREALVGHGRAADELEAVLQADNEAPAVTLVARPGLVEVDELVAGGVDATAGRLARTAAVLRAGDPGELAAVREGVAGVQDEGSRW